MLKIDCHDGLFDHHDSINVERKNQTPARGTATNIGGGVISVAMYGTVNPNTYYYPLTSPAAVNFVGIVSILGGFTAEWEVGSSGGMSFLKVWRV